MWILRCSRLLLPLVATESREDLLANLSELAGLSARDASKDEFAQRVEDVWYSHPPRDAARTAIAKLFDALACRNYPEPNVIVVMSAPINILVKNSDRPEEALELVLADFLEFMKENFISGEARGIS